MVETLTQNAFVDGLVQTEKKVASDISMNSKRRATIEASKTA